MWFVGAPTYCSVKLNDTTEGHMKINPAYALKNALEKAPSQGFELLRSNFLEKIMWCLYSRRQHSSARWSLWLIHSRFSSSSSCSRGWSESTRVSINAIVCYMYMVTRYSPSVRSFSSEIPVGEAESGLPMAIPRKVWAGNEKELFNQDQEDVNEEKSRFRRTYIPR